MRSGSATVYLAVPALSNDSETRSSGFTRRLVSRTGGRFFRFFATRFTSQGTVCPPARGFMRGNGSPPARAEVERSFPCSVPQRAGPQALHVPQRPLHRHGPRGRSGSATSPFRGGKTASFFPAQKPPVRYKPPVPRFRNGPAPLPPLKGEGDRRTSHGRAVVERSRPWPGPVSCGQGIGQRHAARAWSRVSPPAWSRFFCSRSWSELSSAVTVRVTPPDT